MAVPAGIIGALVLYLGHGPTATIVAIIVWALGGGLLLTGLIDELMYVIGMTRKPPHVAIAKRTDGGTRS